MTRPHVLLKLTPLEAETTLSAVEEIAEMVGMGECWENEPPTLLQALHRVEKKLREFTDPQEVHP